MSAIGSVFSQTQMPHGVLAAAFYALIQAERLRDLRDLRDLRNPADDPHVLPPVTDTDCEAVDDMILR